MDSESRMKRKKIALTMTKGVNFSCVYFTCMKKSTTRMALMVAMSRATTMLKGPSSTRAASTVSVVPASSASQMPIEVLSDEICSEVELWSDIASLTCVDRLGTAKGTDKSRQYRQSANTGRRFQSACSIPGYIFRAMPY